MKRHHPQWLVVAALIATLAAGAPARATVANPAHALVRPAARSATAARVHTPRHHRFHAHHARVVTLSSRRATAASAVPRPTPIPSRPAGHHRATVPVLVRHGQAPRSSRGGAQHALATPDRGALLSHEPRNLGRSQRLVPMCEFDPVRSGRGPPRAGPERTLPARALPALAGSDPDAQPPASARVSPLTASPHLVSRSAVIPSPSAVEPISAVPTPVPLKPRLVSDRLHACRREGTAARFLTPS